MKSSVISIQRNSPEKRRSRHACFTQLDYLVIRRAMDKLPLMEKVVVEMRFFHNFSINEISRILRIAWDEADSLIDSALLILRQACLSDSDFSRGERQLLAA